MCLLVPMERPRCKKYCHVDHLVALPNDQSASHTVTTQSTRFRSTQVEPTANTFLFIKPHVCPNSNYAQKKNDTFNGCTISKAKLPPFSTTPRPSSPSLCSEQRTKFDLGIKISNRFTKTSDQERFPHYIPKHDVRRRHTHVSQKTKKKKNLQLQVFVSHLSRFFEYKVSSTRNLRDDFLLQNSLTVHQAVAVGMVVLHLLLLRNGLLGHNLGETFQAGSL